MGVGSFWKPDAGDHRIPVTPAVHPTAHRIAHTIPHRIARRGLHPRPRHLGLRWLLGLGLFFSLVLPAYGSGAGLFDLEGVLPEMNTCRFLATDTHIEQRLPLSEKRVLMLESLLRQTTIGDMVATALHRYWEAGVGYTGRPLRFFEVQRSEGPIAAYFENGQMDFSSRLFDIQGNTQAEQLNQLYTAASFVVHEGIHAMAHHLYLKGHFPAYRADTKVNEALAYFVQGLYLEEVREQVPSYEEVYSIPAWERCTRQIVRILTDLGIHPDSNPETVYDLFVELQLESDARMALRWERLWQYYEFIQHSDESASLWALGREEGQPVQVIREITDLVASDVEDRHCNFDRTFAKMRNRIILYAHYADTPLGVRACQYFVDFVVGLMEEDSLSAPLRDRIDLWLLQRGLVMEDSETLLDCPFESIALCTHHRQEGIP
jgi:hypothetical protein